MLLDWPAYSPDASPIENIWNYLKNRVSRRGPLSRDELVRYIKEEWELIPQHTINKLVRSFRRRCVGLVETRRLAATMAWMTFGVR